MSRRCRVLPSWVTTQAELEAFAAFCRRTGAELVTEFDEKVTHVVTATVGPRRLVHKRWLKMFQGMLKGCWVLSTDWIVSSEANGRWLPEERYEVTATL